MSKPKRPTIHDAVILVDGNRLKTDRYLRLREADIIPRQDFVELAHMIGARVHASDSDFLLRPLERKIRINVTVPFFAMRTSIAVDIVLSTSEKVALPMAAFLSLFRQRNQASHALIAHRLNSTLKRILFRCWPLQHTFSQVICVANPQAQFAREHLRIAPANVHFIHDKVDQHFYRPKTERDADYLLVVGREQRDYQTLLQALSGTGIHVVIVASSPWSSAPLRIPQGHDSTVTVLSDISHRGLRQLYAAARLVVVPLNDVDYAAGVNTLLEAMAMGKAVIATDTRGLWGYVEAGETGLMVPAADATVLRHSVLELWHGSRERRRLGTNARQAVVEGLNLDAYLGRIVDILGVQGGA